MYVFVYRVEHYMMRGYENNSYARQTNPNHLVHQYPSRVLVSTKRLCIEDEYDKCRIRVLRSNFCNGHVLY